MKFLYLLIFAFCVSSALFSQEKEPFIPYEEGIDPEYLTGLDNRWEMSVYGGYTNFNNFSTNFKTTTLKSYNEGLSGGVNAGLTVGYNFTNQFQVKAIYGYRTVKNNDVYKVTYPNDSNSVMILEDDYQFHQFAIGVNYRFPLAGERLFWSPEMSLGYVMFSNKGQRNDLYEQKSSGWILGAGLNFDYMASDIFGIGLSGNYLYSSFLNNEMTYPSQAPEVPIEVDADFGILDISVKFYVFF